MPADYSSIPADPADIWSGAAREPTITLGQTSGLRAGSGFGSGVTAAAVAFGPDGHRLSDDGVKWTGGLLKAATQPAEKAVRVGPDPVRRLGPGQCGPPIPPVGTMRRPLSAPGVPPHARWI